MDTWDQEKENIKPKRKGHSSAQLVRLTKSRDAESLAEFNRKQAEWENKVNRKFGRIRDPPFLYQSKINPR